MRQFNKYVKVTQRASTVESSPLSRRTQPCYIISVSFVLVPPAFPNRASDCKYVFIWALWQAAASLLALTDNAFYLWTLMVCTAHPDRPAHFKKVSEASRRRLVGQACGRDARHRSTVFKYGGIITRSTRKQNKCFCIHLFDMQVAWANVLLFHDIWRVRHAWAAHGCTEMSLTRSVNIRYSNTGTQSLQLMLISPFSPWHEYTMSFFT